MLHSNGRLSGREEKQTIIPDHLPLVT